MQLKELRDRIVKLRSFFQADLDRGIRFNETNTCGFRELWGAFNTCNVLVGYIEDLAFNQEIVEDLKKAIDEELKKQYTPAINFLFNSHYYKTE